MIKKEYVIYSCPVCKEDVPNSSFCGNCGTEIKKKITLVSSVKCSVCNKEIANLKYCGACGAKIKEKHDS